VSLPPIVVMGVSGCGKTTVGMQLAQRIDGGEFIDADDLHPVANVDKMRAGIALDDIDRAPWLTRVGDAMREVVARGGTPVVACSSLKHSYRQRIRAEEPAAFFVLLDVPRLELERRLHNRKGHYMPISLLNSQLATLEPLGPEESGVAVQVDNPGIQVVDRVLAAVVQRR
jgi:gluconokinase